MIYVITKSYTTSISKNFNNQKFSTSLTKTVDVKSADELAKESDKLFSQAKMLTDLDVKKTLI